MNMRKLKINVDQDEVQAHWVKEVIRRHNERFGTSHRREDVTDYFKMETMLEGGKPFIREHFSVPGLYENLEPVEGAIDGMKRLFDLGHDLNTVSSVPSGISYDEKQVWIKRLQPWFDLNNFKAAQRKDDVTGDVLIDDAPKHILAWAATKRFALVFDAPWNKELRGPYITRVRDWSEVLEVVIRISRCT